MFLAYAALDKIYYEFKKIFSSEHRINQSDNCFHRYCLSGIGATAMVFLLAIFLDVIIIEDSAWMPGFGKDSCYLQSNTFLSHKFKFTQQFGFIFSGELLTKTIFFYMPMAILLLFNCVSSSFW